MGVGGSFTCLFLSPVAAAGVEFGDELSGAKVSGDYGGCWKSP